MTGSMTCNMKITYSETWNSEIHCYEYDVAVGSVWTLEEANDEYEDYEDYEDYEEGGEGNEEDSGGA